MPKSQSPPPIKTSYHAWFSKKQQDSTIKMLENQTHYQYTFHDGKRERVLQTTKNTPIANEWLTHDNKHVVATEVMESDDSSNKYLQRFPDGIYLGKVFSWIKCIYKE